MKTEIKETIHTPTPWHYAPDLSNHGTQLIYGPDNYLVADAGRINKRNLEETRLNAAFIVRAVNSHEELLKSVKELFACYRDDLRADIALVEGWRNAIEKAEAAQ